MSLSVTTRRLARADSTIFRDILRAPPLAVFPAAPPDRTGAEARRGFAQPSRPDTGDQRMTMGVRKGFLSRINQRWRLHKRDGASRHDRRCPTCGKPRTILPEMHVIAEAGSAGVKLQKPVTAS